MKSNLVLLLMSFALTGSTAFAEKVQGSNPAHCAIGAIMRKLQATGIRDKIYLQATLKYAGSDPNHLEDDDLARYIFSESMSGAACFELEGQITDKSEVRYPIVSSVCINYKNTYDLYGSKVMYTTCDAYNWVVLNRKTRVELISSSTHP